MEWTDVEGRRLVCTLIRACPICTPTLPRVLRMANFITSLRTESSSRACLAGARRSRAMTVGGLFHLFRGCDHTRGEAAQAKDAGAAQYVRSQSCERCHKEAYAGWKQTRMANVVLDPKVHPEAVVGDFVHPDPARTFKLDQVAFTWQPMEAALLYKSWRRLLRTACAVGCEESKWLPYHVEKGTDWWVPYYGETNMERPTGRYTAGYIGELQHRYQAGLEWNVGCEKCHGPGGLHVAHPTRSNIVNPDRLDYMAANDTCIRMPQPGAAALPNPIQESTMTGRWDIRRARALRISGSLKR